jgi:hypothetical protein
MIATTLGTIPTTAVATMLMMPVVTTTGCSDLPAPATAGAA